MSCHLEMIAARSIRQAELDEVIKNWGKVVESALQGKEVSITREQRPLLKLVRIPEQEEPYRQPGSAKGLNQMREDFDEPLADFREYMLRKGGVSYDLSTNHCKL